MCKVNLFITLITIYFTDFVVTNQREDVREETSSREGPLDPDLTSMKQGLQVEQKQERPLEQYLGNSYKTEWIDDNFENILKELKISDWKIALTKIYNKSVFRLTENNGMYCLNSYLVGTLPWLVSRFINDRKSVSFRLNEEFPQETVDGRSVKTVFTVEGNKLIQVDKDVETCQETLSTEGVTCLKTLTTKEFSQEEVGVTLQVNQVVCKSGFKKLPTDKVVDGNCSELF